MINGLACSVHSNVNMTLIFIARISRYCITLRGYSRGILRRYFVPMVLPHILSSTGNATLCLNFDNNFCFLSIHL